MDAQEMAKTIRNLALSGVMLFLLVGSTWATEMEQIAMTATSGTLVMKRVEAQKASVSNNNGVLTAEGLTMSIRMDNGEMAEAESAKGVVIINGDDDQEEDLTASPVSSQVIRDYGESFREIRFPGDIMLDGGPEPDEMTKARLGDRGEVETKKLIWSEAFEKYFLPNDFRQQTSLPNGAMFLIEGACAMINPDFNDWTYYGSEDRDAVMTYVRPDVTE